MRKILYFTLAFVVVFGFSIFYYIQNLQPTVVVDNVTWRQVLCWNFKDGLYPKGWGWGNYSIVEGKLQIEDLTEEESVYFLRVTHGGDFVLETKVKLIQGYHTVYAAGQLLTRDSSKQKYESGMVLLPELDQAIVRHMADRVDYVYEAFEINMSIDYGEWYIMRLIVHNGRVRAFLDENKIYDTSCSFPVTTYGEPHLAVRYGVAVFEYVRILLYHSSLRRIVPSGCENQTSQ